MKKKAAALLFQSKHSYQSASTATKAASSATSSFWEPQSPVATNASTKVAVLGGGITGLTCAYLISKIAPRAKIDVFERSSRFGGWLQSSRLNVHGDELIFEHGPRSLRPAILSAAGLSTMDLISDLQLDNGLLSTPKDSPAARVRCIYYPDKLNALPSSLSGIFSPNQLYKFLSQPLYKGSILPVITEYWKDPRPAALEDESIASFFRRRFSTAMADNLISAMIHGIYAGDIEKLSAKSIMSRLWHYEMSRGSVLKGALNDMQQQQAWQTAEDSQLLEPLSQKLATSSFRSLLQPLSRASIYTFKNGVEHLVKTLVQALESKPNVTLHLNAPVSGLRPVLASSGAVEVEVSRKATGGDIIKSVYTHVASALPAPSLLSACLESQTLRAQDALKYAVPSVTVMVVNLYYKQLNALPFRGFGYLIPRSVPVRENPERALGVVFDSVATPELDDTRGTKLTVMLGGHWWDGADDLPSEDEGISMARAVLANQMGLTLEPVAAKAKLQRDCIPQYVVGHQEKGEALFQLINDKFGKALDCFGASWDGISVNDCIKSAYLASQRFQRGQHREYRPFPLVPYSPKRVSAILSGYDPDRLARNQQGD